MDNRYTLMIGLARALANTPINDPLAMRLCSAFRFMVRAENAAIAVGGRPEVLVRLGSVGADAERIEDAQQMLGEGPTHDVLRTGVAVSGLTHIEQELRWPLLVDAIAEGGAVPHMHAFPLRPDSLILGVVSVHRHEDGPLALSSTDAQTVADAIGLMLAGEFGWDAELNIPQDRDGIDQAVGMVVAQLRIPPRDALAVLRAHAFAAGVSLPEVCAQVRSRELDFRQPDEDER